MAYKKTFVSSNLDFSVEFEQLTKPSSLAGAFPEKKLDTVALYSVNSELIEIDVRP
jgi:hypothetical protein